ncbi:MAG: hypothetical protein E7340_04515 [Clostridiales bacterium]|nr:hypothetical protein [Clostridiales bacterium]
MKKFVVFMLSLILSLSPMALGACDGQTPHEHEYKMASDSKAHWNVCSCGDTKDQEKHYGGIATETAKAQCEVCGQEYGDFLSPDHTHSYSNLKYNTDNHWYECSCGKKSTLEAHKGGTATETQKAKCSVCNQEYGNLLVPGHTHDYSKQVATDKYLSSAATCKSKALYFYSCECGASGSKTFESGAIGSHIFSKGECIHCGTPEKEDVVTGPYQVSKTIWYNTLIAIAASGVANGKFTIGPIENPGEYTIYESDGNVVRQRKYDNDLLTEELYAEKDGSNYYVYQEVEGVWYKVQDNSQMTSYQMIQTTMSYGAMFYNSYDGFTYDEDNHCYYATNLIIQGNVFESVKICFENDALKSLNIVDYNDEDELQTHKGFSQELINIGTTNLTLPEVK